MNKKTLALNLFSLGVYSVIGYASYKQAKLIDKHIQNNASLRKELLEKTVDYENLEESYIYLYCYMPEKELELFKRVNSHRIPDFIY